MIKLQPGANLPCRPPSWRPSPAQPAPTPSSSQPPSFRCPPKNPDYYFGGEIEQLVGGHLVFDEYQNNVDPC